MHHAADPAELHGGACLGEEGGIGFAVVPQGVELGGVAEGGGQAREVLGPAGIQADVIGVRALAEVLLIEPVQLGLGEDVAAVAEVLQRLGLPQLQGSGGGVAEDLQPQGGTLPVPGQLGRHGAEVGAGAVAHDGQLAAVDAQGLGVLMDPAESPVGVLRRGGKGGLRGQAVAHVDDDDPRVAAELAADGVVGGDVVDHEAAAVEVEQGSVAGEGVRPVDPDGHLAPGAGDGLVLHGVDGGGLGLVVVEGIHRLAGALYRDGAHVGEGVQGIAVEGGNLGIERHTISSCIKESGAVRQPASGITSSIAWPGGSVKDNRPQARPGPLPPETAGRGGRRSPKAAGKRGKEPGSRENPAGKVTPPGMEIFLRFLDIFYCTEGDFVLW